MDLALRVSIRKLLIVSLVVLALGFGYAVHGVSDAARSGSPRRAPLVTKKFSASDLLLAAASAQGMHMRMGGITTSSGPDHTNDIQLAEFDFGADLPITAINGGRTLAKSTVAEIDVRHSLDKYSLPLLKALLHPAAPQAASFFFTNLSGPGGTAFDFLQIDTTGTFVSKYTMDSSEESPTEEIRFNFATMKLTYRLAGSADTIVNYNLITGVTT